MWLSVIILALVAISNNGINAKPPSKIINGKKVDITEVPYAVMIRDSSSGDSVKGLVCGGTLISLKHILTAAHCLREDRPGAADVYHHDWLHVIAGKISYIPGVKKLKIKKAYVHPKYTGNLDDTVNDRADLAVLELEEKIQLSPSQQPIPLADVEPEPYTKGLIVGWGYTSGGARAELAKNLQGARQEVYNFHICTALDEEFGFVKDELCVSSNLGNSFCEGDSGGPLVVKGKLAGVLSNSLECGSEEPGAVSNVAYYRSWILDAVEGTAESKKMPFSV